MYIYNEANDLYFNLSIKEESVLFDIVNRAFKTSAFYKNDSTAKDFYKAVNILKDCYFLDFMGSACESIIWALHTILENYFSATNYPNILNHPLYAFFCELDRYLYAFLEA